MCGGMAYIQSATAEIKRGKKKEEETGQNIMSASATQGGHKTGAEQNTALLTPSMFPSGWSVNLFVNNKHEMVGQQHCCKSETRIYIMLKVAIQV